MIIMIYMQFIYIIINYLILTIQENRFTKYDMFRGCVDYKYLYMNGLFACICEKEKERDSVCG